VLHCRDLSNQHIFINLDTVPILGAATSEALAVEILLGGIPVNIKVKQRRAKLGTAKTAKD
jgi:hypothetical protein